MSATNQQSPPRRRHPFRLTFIGHSERPDGRCVSSYAVHDTRAEGQAAQLCGERSAPAEARADKT